MFNQHLVLLLNAQVVDKLYILKIYKTNLKKVVERFLLLGDFW